MYKLHHVYFLGGQPCGPPPSQKYQILWGLLQLKQELCWGLKHKKTKQNKKHLELNTDPLLLESKCTEFLKTLVVLG